jgi:hypothetical protein
MDKKQVNKVLRLVKAGNAVKFNDLRSAASAIGIKTKAGVKADDLLVGLKTHIDKKGVGPGRPSAQRCPIVGYKVKIGLRYPATDGTLTTSMKEAKVFKDTADCQKAVDELLANGQVRLWGKDDTRRVRAEFLPRYGKSE